MSGEVVQVRKGRIMSEQQAAPENAAPICNGWGWIVNHAQPGALITCRGCDACARPRKPKLEAVPPEPKAAAADHPVAQENSGLVPKKVEKPIAPAVAPAPPVPLAVAPAPRASAKEGGRCPSGGSLYELSHKEKTTRRTKCPGCGKAIVIKDVHFTPDFLSMTIPGHNLEKGSSVVAPLVIVPTPHHRRSRLRRCLSRWCPRARSAVTHSAI